jgi:hypothetical protein
MAGTLIVYLSNTGETALNVDAEDNPQDPAPGLDVSSETLTIAPGGRSPLDIIIEESPMPRRSTRPGFGSMCGRRVEVTSQIICLLAYV